MTNAAKQVLRVLIVDNFEETLELYSAVFASKGYSVRRAMTCAEALALVPAFRPNAIFTSIVGVDHSGLNLCGLLRRMPETVKALIVAVTSYGWPRDNAEVMAGFDYFLVRPVELQSILETMRHLVGYQGSTVQAVRIPLQS